MLDFLPIQDHIQLQLNLKIIIQYLEVIAYFIKEILNHNHLNTYKMIHNILNLRLIKFYKIHKLK